MSLTSRRLLKTAIIFFEKVMMEHEKVEKIDLVEEDDYKAVFEIYLADGRILVTYIGDVYVLTAADEDYFYGLLKRNNKKVNDVIEFYKYVVTNNLDIYNLTAIERKNVDEFVTFMFKAQNNEN